MEIEGVKVHAHVEGQGEHTVILLSGLGTPGPVYDFGPLSEKLSMEGYRIVTIELPGYGISLDTDKERTVENILSEIRGTMEKLDIKPPYILMPHSISGLYSLYYANKYPEEVEAIIAIDCSMPKQFDDAPIPAISDSAQSVFHFMDKSGITRLTKTTAFRKIVK